MKTIHRIFVGILYAIITTNCFGEDKCGMYGTKYQCRFCPKNNYIAAYTMNGVAVELNPYSFFLAMAATQHDSVDQIYWCFDFEKPQANYDNLRKAFAGVENNVTLHCIKLDADYNSTGDYEDVKYSDIKIGGIKIAKWIHNTLSDSSKVDVNLITCKPCPNEGETNSWSGWQGVWTATSGGGYYAPTGGANQYYTIANCKGYQRDEKGTYEWVNQSGNNVTSLKCYYTE